MNDALGEIKADAEFGRKVSEAASRLSRGEPVDIQSGCHVNAATAVACEHADTVSLIAVGGNHASVLLQTHNGGLHLSPEARKQLLEELADKMGYRLVKKPVKG